ncbi:MAG: twin-arginine translocase subunit TatC [Novosphingopyxis baekryungensis]|uniref:twin-arginine translocase subunit TatC n=1 Tax=Novosphingopyxis baekryungensis TaxID=279369 RepID=UPI0003B6B277|nr:twin-arginine translocase subunit TatC [Novosphingopyxis baekryungensis]MDE0933707.1 twin-arginine translocase subunit TatC [Novosphingopyxis baekryungensis]
MTNDIDDSKAPLLDHLIELRGRLIKCLLALVVAFCIGAYFADDIFGMLVRPLTDAFPPGQGRLIYTKLYEAFFVEIKVAVFTAFLLAFPVIATQLWRFVAPGLYNNEKQAFLPFLFASPILFAAGASLAYFLVMPLAFTFFLGYSGMTGGLDVEALPAVGEYLDLVMRFVLAFGVAFQLPILLLLLHRAGIVTREQLVGFRRYMLVIAFLVAAILTPPDIISQFMLGVPLVLLYESSLILMALTDRKKAKQKATE